jgi:hypothetical protein
MTATYTLTETKTFTLTEARYVTSKIATDLQSMQSYYGSPPNERITKFAEEAAILLAKRYLASVEYGFKRNGQVIFALKYTAKSDGTLEADDRPGKIPPGLNMDGAVFYSYLRHNVAWYLLTASQQAVVEASLPIQRTGAGEPAFSGNGYWETSRSYSRNGEGVERLVFKQQS